MLLEEEVQKIADAYIANNHPGYINAPYTLAYISEETSDNSLAEELAAELGVEASKDSQPYFSITYSFNEKDPLTLHIHPETGEVMKTLRLAL